MTDALKNAETDVEETHVDPLEKAKAGGYVEAEAPSREHRVKALIGDFEHVMKHNSPISIAMMAELKALLVPEVESADDAEHSES